MRDKIEDILSLAADMESCIPVGDGLTRFVGTFADDELAEEDLMFATAAGAGPSFETFRKRFNLDKK